MTTETARACNLKFWLARYFQSDLSIYLLSSFRLARSDPYTVPGKGFAVHVF